MQEGSLRVDANVNLHIETPDGKVATPIVEVKNMNSFRAVERALDYEAARQFSEWQETGHQLGRSCPSRPAAGTTRPTSLAASDSKEESSDYRYFPDPDLVPVVFTPEETNAVQASLGELPAALRRRLEGDFGLSAYDADVLVNQGHAAVDFFIDTADTSRNAKLAANWTINNVLRTLKVRPDLTIENFPISSKTLGTMLAMIPTGGLPGHRAQELYNGLLATGSNNVPAEVSRLGIVQADQTEMLALADEVIAANPKFADDVRNGKLQAIGALIGQAKKRNPNIDPRQLGDIFLQRIKLNDN